VVQRLVEGDSELLAIDGGGGGEAGAVFAPGILEAAAELDFENTQTGSPVTSNYTGKGGVKLSSLIRRAAFALRFSDFNILISSAIKSDSRIEGKLRVRARVTVGYVTSDDGDVARLVVVRTSQKPPDKK